MSRTPFLKRGEFVTGFKFDRNIRDGSCFILFALAPPEVLFASVVRCLRWIERNSFSTTTSISAQPRWLF